MIVSHITFRDCRVVVHSFSDNLSRNSCIIFIRYYVVRINRYETSITTRVNTMALVTGGTPLFHHYLILDWIPVINSLAPTAVSTKFDTFAPACLIFCLYLLLSHVSTSLCFSLFAPFLSFRSFLYILLYVQLLCQAGLTNPLFFFVQHKAMAQKWRRY